MWQALFASRLLARRSSALHFFGWESDARKKSRRWRGGGEGRNIDSAPHIIHTRRNDFAVAAETHASLEDESPNVLVWIDGSSLIPGGDLRQVSRDPEKAVWAGGEAGG